jgi:hypothetical protein
MLPSRSSLVALLLPALIAAAVARPQDAVDPPPAGGVREVQPELFYMQDDAGRLVPVPGFQYRDFVEMFRIKEGLTGPALPPPAVFESLAVKIDARNLAVGASSCPAEIECVVRQSRGGWAAVPLALRELLLTEPPRHDGPGRMLVDAAPEQGGYRAWFEPPATGGDVRHSVRLLGRLPVESSAGQDAFDFRLPVAMASRVEILSRRSASVVSVRPDIAGRIESVAAADEGTVITVTGLSGEVRIRIADPAANPGVAEAAVEAFCESSVRIDGRTARIEAVLRLTNLGPGTDRLRIRLPPGATLTRVGGSATLVKRTGSADKPAIEVAVERIADGGIEVDCEESVDPSGNRPLEPLGFEIEGVAPWRQSGRVSLVVDGDWQASWDEATGLRRVDPPAGERPAGFVASFAYDFQPASLPIRVRPRRSRVLIEPEYRYAVSTARITLTGLLRVAARGAPVGSIAVSLPPEWVVEDAGPAGLVDAAAVRIEGRRVALPFVQPLSGDAVVEFRATRLIDPAAERVAWAMPVPQAELVGPATVIVSSDADIELLPEAEGIAGLVRETGTAIQFGEADRITLAYRLDAADKGSFAATRRFLPRRVEATILSRVAVDEQEMAVQQTLRLNVLHLPLEFLELAVPDALAANGSFEVRQGDELLDTQRISAGVEPDPVAGSLTLLRAFLPMPLLGSGEIRISYRVATPELPAEATAAVDLPLPLPVTIGSRRQSAVVDESAALTVLVRGEAWRRDVAGQPGGGRQYTAVKSQYVLPLAISTRLREAASITVVEAAWLQTRLVADTREDIATYVVSGPGGPLELKLPEDVPEDAAVEVRLDGRPLAGITRRSGCFVLELPDQGGPRLIEIRSSAAWGGAAAGLGLPWPLPLDAPEFPGDVLQRRFYRELLLSPDDHPIGLPTRWTSQQRWAWNGLGWWRTATSPSSELSGWVAAAAGLSGPQQFGLLADTPPLRQSRFVYAGVGSPGRAAAWVVPTWLLVLVASGTSLAIGLALVYRPAWRQTPVLLGLLASAALLAAAAPQAAVLMAQAAVPGAALAVLAATIRWFLEQPTARPRPAVPAAASSLTRTNSPAVSLIVGAGSESGSARAAAFGRDAS